MTSLSEMMIAADTEMMIAEDTDGAFILCTGHAATELHLMLHKYA